MGKAVIMGRKTYESIGKPLPGRINVILSRDWSYHPKFTEKNDVLGASSLPQALSYLQSKGHDDIFIIGGGSLYEEALPVSSRLYLSFIDNSCDGDTLFPARDDDEWKETEKHKLKDHTFIAYKRIK